MSKKSLGATNLFSLWNRRSLGAKLGLASALGALVLVFITTLILGLFNYRQADINMKDQVRGLGRSLAVATGTDLMARPVEVGRRAQEIRLRDPSKNILYIEFVNQEGQQVGETGGERSAELDKFFLPITEGKELTEELITGKYGGKPALYLTAPIILIAAQPTSADGAGTGESTSPSEPDATADTAAAKPTERVLGAVRVVYSKAALRRSLKTFVIFGVVFALLLAGISIFVVNIWMRQLTRPLFTITEGARLIAEGNLGTRLEVKRVDELGMLARSFNDMAGGLASLVRRFRDSFSLVERSTGAIQNGVEQFVEGGREQRRNIEEISATVNELASTTRSLVDSMEQLSASAEETSSSVMEMVASIDEVATNADSLERRVNETASTTEEMVYAVREIDKTVEKLNEITASTAAAMTEMDASIRHVERNAEQTRQLSEAATRQAEEGAGSVSATASGMEGIRATVNEAAGALSKLGKRSEEIGKILGVIDEIAEQTNLLALNAAIIAAQAGEHGKGFAVVAEEIRRLAERTGSSTKEIAQLIGSVQSDVKNSVSAMEHGVKAVDQGVGLSKQAGESLKRIIDSAVKSAEMVSAIAGSTKEQAQGIRGMVSSVEQIRNLVESISKATSEQSQGGTQIMQAVENMREITSLVGRATSEQNRGSKLISEAVGRITQMIGAAHLGIGEQAKGADVIAARIESLQTLTDKYQMSATEAQRALLQLRDNTRQLESDLGKFKM